MTLPRFGTLALWGIVTATASIVYEERLPVFSVGINLRFPDVLLLGSLALIVVRWLFVREFTIVRTPLDLPILTFYGATLLSTVVAISLSSGVGEQVQLAIGGARVFSYYLTFFIVTNLIRERRQLDLLLNGVLLLATIVAAAMIGQYVLGDSVQLLPGRVEALETQGTRFEAVTRILPPGFSIVVVSFVTILSMLALGRLKPTGLLRVLQCALMGMALMVTFLRSYWAALIVVVFVMLYLVKGADRRRFIVGGGAVVSAAALTVLVVVNTPKSSASTFLGASLHRFNTLLSTRTFLGQGGSVEYRMIETDYALSAIASSPLIGQGLGAKYRPWDPRLDWIDADGVAHDLRGHIHNGHLWILLQSGLLGYLSLTWLSLAFFRRGFGYWRVIPDDRMRGVVLGLTLAYLAVFIAAVANSSFMQWYWTPVIGIMLGVNEVVLRQTGWGDSAA